MFRYFYHQEQVEKAKIKYILSIGRRQPMHIGHKQSLAKIMKIQGIKLVYVMGSSNLYGDELFDPINNPLDIAQEIEQFKVVFPDYNDVIFLPILDYKDMSDWGPAIKASMDRLNINIADCAIYFIGKPEDALIEATSFYLETGEKVTLNPGQWLIDAMAYYGFAIWIDKDIEVNLNISARKLRNLDLNNLSESDRSLIAAPEYLLDLAKSARLKNGLSTEPLTLNDLSVLRATCKT